MVSFGNYHRHRTQPFTLPILPIPPIPPIPPILPNTQIAHHLPISQSTPTLHIKTFLQILQLPSRTTATSV
ncbi:MAG: hypothetical protein SAK42_21210, partial [Oscillatoria sp. PMC 1076.18]|nr:hypothetical protein [Oscillatoria sp. PMC 1076.18]